MVGLAEGLEVGAFLGGGAGREAFGRAREALHAVRHDDAEIDAVLGEARVGGDVGRVEPAALLQLEQVDQQHVAGEGR